MTPNLMKSHKDTAKFAETPTTEDLQRSGNAPSMDGDHTAKTMDAGATKAAAGTDMTEGLHETAKQGDAAGTKETGGGTSIFNAAGGAVGSAFTDKGAIGGMAQKIGGPMHSQGAIGSAFTTQGAIGGKFQDLAKKNESH